MEYVILLLITIVGGVAVHQINKMIDKYLD